MFISVPRSTPLKPRRKGGGGGGGEGGGINIDEGSQKENVYFLFKKIHSQIFKIQNSKE